MFLEKHSRYFRKFDFRFWPRNSHAPLLPLTGGDDDYSICDALHQRIEEEKALEVQPNGDILEIMKATYHTKERALVLLIHRASPNAAEPMYRKKARLAAGSLVSVREAEKEPGEEQTVSAHLVIADGYVSPGVYRGALEEIPSISMAAIRRIISTALREYKYEFEYKKKTSETYITFSPEGVKSETMTNALKTGKLNFITLTRPADAKFVDSEGIFSPELEIMRIRITGEIEAKNWKDTMSRLFRKARGDGWIDFKVDIDLDDNRNKTIKIDREGEAAEILFIRSEQADFSTTLAACSVEIVEEVVKKAADIARSN